MKAVIGITSTVIPMMDFDNCELEKTIRLARKAMKKFKLEGFAVVMSSKNNYHVVFNKLCKRYPKCIKIMAWLALNVNTIEAYKYLCLQIIKQAATLRLSKKAEKPRPKVIYVEGKYDKGIKIYYEYYLMVKEFEREVEESG
ncbi:MAG: hypothetical protein QW794_04035 [Thermosphaera sp.]